MPLAVCATPIGNLADVTLRVLDELARRGHRSLRGHASHADPPRAPRDRGAPPLVSPAQRGDSPRRSHAAARRRRADRARLGRRPARASTTRARGSSPPRIAAGVAVTVLPGPSAVETALVASGLAGEQYRFVGYLPRSEKERAALWQELSAWPHPTVAFESPKRLPATLASLAAADPDRHVAVCRELTKLYEEVVCEHRSHPGGAVPRGAEGRGDARDRARRRDPRETRTRRSQPWSSSSQRARSAASPPASWRGSPEAPATRSTAARSRRRSSPARTLPACRHN